MMALYDYWMNKAREMRARGLEEGPDFLIRADQIEACAREMLKAFMDGTD